MIKHLQIIGFGIKQYMAYKKFMNFSLHNLGIGIHQIFL